MNKYEFIKTLAEIQEKDLLSVWELSYDGGINYKQLQPSDDMETIYQQFGKTIFPTKKALTKHLDRRNNKWDRHSYSIKLKPTEKLLEILNEKQKILIKQKCSLLDRILFKITKHNPYELNEENVCIERIVSPFFLRSNGYGINHVSPCFNAIDTYFRRYTRFVEMKSPNE